MDEGRSTNVLLNEDDGLMWRLLWNATLDFKAFQQLYAFQKWAVHFLYSGYCKKKDIILNQDAGMGKTVEICSHFDILQRNVKKSIQLIVLCSGKKIEFWHYHLYVWSSFKPLTIVRIDKDFIQTRREMCENLDIINSDVIIIDVDFFKKLPTEIFNVFVEKIVVLDDSEKVIGTKLSPNLSLLSNVTQKILLTSAKLMALSNRKILWQHLRYLGVEKLPTQKVFVNECLCMAENLLFFPWLDDIYFRQSWHSYEKYRPIVNAQDFEKQITAWKEIYELGSCETQVNHSQIDEEIVTDVQVMSREVSIFENADVLNDEVAMETVEITNNENHQIPSLVDDNMPNISIETSNEATVIPRVTTIPTATENNAPSTSTLPLNPTKRQNDNFADLFERLITPSIPETNPEATRQKEMTVKERNEENKLINRATASTSISSNKDLTTVSMVTASTSKNQTTNTTKRQSDCFTEMFDKLISPKLSTSSIIEKKTNSECLDTLKKDSNSVKNLNTKTNHNNLSMTSAATTSNENTRVSIVTATVTASTSKKTQSQTSECCNKLEKNTELEENDGRKHLNNFNSCLTFDSSKRENGVDQRRIAENVLKTDIREQSRDKNETKEFSFETMFSRLIATKDAKDLKIKPNKTIVSVSYERMTEIDKKGELNSKILKNNPQNGLNLNGIVEDEESRCRKTTENDNSDRKREGLKESGSGGEFYRSFDRFFEQFMNGNVPKNENNVEKNSEKVNVNPNGIETSTKNDETNSITENGQINSKKFPKKRSFDDIMQFFMEPTSSTNQSDNFTAVKSTIVNSTVVNSNCTTVKIINSERNDPSDDDDDDDNDLLKSLRANVERSIDESCYENALETEVADKPVIEPNDSELNNRRILEADTCIDMDDDDDIGACSGGLDVYSMFDRLIKTKRRKT